MHSTSSSGSTRLSLIKCEARKREIEVVPFLELYDSVLEAVIADEKPLIQKQVRQDLIGTTPSRTAVYFPSVNRAKLQRDLENVLPLASGASGWAQMPET